MDNPISFDEYYRKKAEKENPKIKINNFTTPQKNFGMFQIKKLHGDKYLIKSKWLKWLEFSLIWSNDKRLPEASAVGITGYKNKFNEYTYRVNLDTIKILKNDK